MAPPLSTPLAFESIISVSPLPLHLMHLEIQQFMSLILLFWLLFPAMSTYHFCSGFIVNLEIFAL